MDINNIDENNIEENNIEENNNVTLDFSEKVS